MSSPNTISSDKLIRLIGLPHCPRLLDVRLDDDFEAEPVLIPGSVRRSWQEVEAWSQAVGEDAVVICRCGAKISHGAAAWLRHPAWPAVLEGGLEAWRDGGLPCCSAATGCRLAIAGRTLWVTRARPKIDRIACPWLIRRFIDPAAVFLFVAPAEVAGSPNASAPRPSTSRASSGAIAASTAPSMSMLEEFGLLAALAARSIVRARRYRTAGPRPGSGGAARRLARPVAHVSRRSRAARCRPRCTMLLPLVRATRPRRPTIGRRARSRSEPWIRTARPAMGR